MKRKLPNVFESTMHGTKSFVMDGRYHGKGREYFDTKSKAIGRAEEIYNEVFGVRMDAVEPGVILDAQRGQSLLEPLGGSIVEACRREADRLKRELIGKVTTAKAIEDWIKFKERDTEIDSKTIANYKSRTKRFSLAHGAKQIHEMDFETVHKWIHSLQLAQITKMDYRDTLSEFFDWCVRPNKWLLENPCMDIELKEPREKAVSVFHVEEARRIFEAAKKADTDVLRYFVLCTFVGLRPEAEAEKVDRAHLNKNILTVDSDKVGDIRYVELEKGVLPWLIRKNWKGKAVGPNFRKRWDTFRVGLGYRLKTSDDSTSALSRPKWPHDVMRHSFCSYHLAKFQNEGLTIHKAGHSVRMFRKHYKNPRPKSEGEKFWALLRL